MYVEDIPLLGIEQGARLDDLARRHEAIWAAIDAVASKLEITPSALSRRCGNDATTFNKSKRVTDDGHQRWPSSETIAKVLLVANMTFEEFGELVDRAMQGDSLSEPNHT